MNLHSNSNNFNDHIYWEDSWNLPKQEKWSGEYED